MKKLVLIQETSEEVKSYPFLSESKKAAEEEIRNTIRRKREKSSNKWFYFHGALLYFDSDYEILSLNEWFEKFQG